MARQVAEENLEAIVDAIHQREVATAQEIARSLTEHIPLRTLQHRLNRLVAAGRLVQEGKRRSARYRIPTSGAAGVAAGLVVVLPLSKAGLEIQKYVRKPPAVRKPVGYNRGFLDAYRPNASAYLSPKERKDLRGVGTPKVVVEAAGTYARQILNRLLIDLSWNSSRLEGNTYSLLDTKRLIEWAKRPKGRDASRSADDPQPQGCDRVPGRRGGQRSASTAIPSSIFTHCSRTICFADPTAAGRLRHIAVGIERSVFHPLEVPQLIEECFDQILATAAAIDRSVRASLLRDGAAAIPSAVRRREQACVAPRRQHPAHQSQSVAAVIHRRPRPPIREAMLGVYELNKIDLMQGRVHLGVRAIGRALCRHNGNLWGNLIRSDCATALPLAKLSVKWCVNA